MTITIMKFDNFVTNSERNLNLIDLVKLKNVLIKSNTINYYFENIKIHNNFLDKRFLSFIYIYT